MISQMFNYCMDLRDQVEIELQKSTLSFQKANSLYRAARETVSLAEQRLLEKTPQDEERPGFDSAWQEMMNQATQRVC